MTQRLNRISERVSELSIQSEADLQRLRKKFGVPKKTTHSPIGNVLDTLLLEYWKVTRKRKAGRSGVKKRVFLVITDGAPSKLSRRFTPRIRRR